MKSKGRNPQQKARTPEREWPDPHRIDARVFSELCETHEIPVENQESLKSFIDGLIDHICKTLSDIRERGGLSDRQKEIEKNADALNRVVKFIQRLEEYRSRRLECGRDYFIPTHGISEINAATSKRFGRVVDARFLEKWGGECSPLNSMMQCLHDDDRIRGRGPVDRSQEVMSWKSNVLWDHGNAVLADVIHEFESVLRDAAAEVARKKPKGGQTRHIVKQNLLTNLAEAWVQLGRQPAINIDGPFGRFVNDILLGIGWGVDTEWVRAALPQAIKDWHRVARR